MNSITNEMFKSRRLVPIDDVQPNPWNYNEQTPEMFEKQKLSIKHQGMMEPILCRREGDKFLIVDGYHRWLACKELEFEKVFVVFLEDMTDEDLKFRLYNMNQLHGDSNQLKLSSNMIEIAKADLNLLKETFPGTDKEMTKLLNMNSFSWDDIKPSEDVPPMVEDSDLTEFSFKVNSLKFELIKSVIDKLQDDLKCSEGRAFELICANYVS